MPTIFTLPWRWTPGPRPERVLLFATRFDAVGIKDRWRLLMGGMKLRSAVMGSPGALGVGMRAYLVAGRFYTLSIWTDEQSLLAFAAGEEHRRAVRSMSDLGPVNGVLLSRETTCARPRWRDMSGWVDASEPGCYHRDAASVGATFP